MTAGSAKPDTQLELLCPHCGYDVRESIQTDPRTRDEIARCPECGRDTELEVLLSPPEEVRAIVWYELVLYGIAIFVPAMTIAVLRTMLGDRSIGSASWLSVASWPYVMSFTYLLTLSYLIMRRIEFVERLILAVLAAFLFASFNLLLV